MSSATTNRLLASQSAERPTARRRGKYRREGTAAWKYSPHEIAAIEADYAREVVRGAPPRYWEEVAVGEELPPVVKGPVTVTSVIAFDQGWGGLYLRAVCWANAKSPCCSKSRDKKLWPASKGLRLDEHSGILSADQASD